MELLSAAYELGKARHKLQHLSQRRARPEEQWRTTEWFEVSKRTLETLCRLEEVEHRTIGDIGKDLWRPRHGNAAKPVR